MSKQRKYLSQESLDAIQGTPPNRPECEEHGGKTLYSSVHDGRAAQVGAMASRRIRVYPCTDHPGKFHVTKEDIRYQQGRGN